VADLTKMPSGCSSPVRFCSDGSDSLGFMPNVANFWSFSLSPASRFRSRGGKLAGGSGAWDFFPREGLVDFECIAVGSTMTTPTETK